MPPQTHIDDLPNDILLHIFFLASTLHNGKMPRIVSKWKASYGLRTVTNNTVYKIPKVMAPFQVIALKVSRRWNYVASSSRLLWSKIDIFDIPMSNKDLRLRIMPKIEQFLRRSEPLMVDIQIYEVLFVGNHLHLIGDANEVVPLILNNAKRIRSLVLPRTIHDNLRTEVLRRVSNSESAVTSPECEREPQTQVADPTLDKSHFPNMTKLHIVSDSVNERCRYRYLDHHTNAETTAAWQRKSKLYPINTLTSLKFREFCFSCTPAAYTRLDSVTTLNIDPFKPTREAFITLFANLPQLHTLVLAFEDPGYVDTPTSSLPDEDDTLSSSSAPSSPPRDPNPRIVAPPTLHNLAIHNKFTFNHPEKGVWCSCALTYLYAPNIEYLEFGECPNLDSPHEKQMLKKRRKAKTLKTIRTRTGALLNNVDGLWVKVFNDKGMTSPLNDDVRTRGGVSFEVDCAWFSVCESISPGLKNAFIPDIFFIPTPRLVSSISFRVTQQFVKALSLQKPLVQQRASSLASGSSSTQVAQCPVTFAFDAIPAESLRHCAEVIEETFRPILGDWLKIEVVNRDFETGGNLLDEDQFPMQYVAEWSSDS